MATHTITVEPAGTQFRCPDTRSVLVGMEYLGADGIQVGCRSGGCGVCRVQVLAGTYTAMRMSKAHVDEGDLARGIVLACRIFPTSDLHVRVCRKGDPVVTPSVQIPDHQH
jgi:ferredoxin